MRRPLYSLDRYIERLLMPWLDEPYKRRTERFEYLGGQWVDFNGNPITKMAIGTEKSAPMGFDSLTRGMVDIAGNKIFEKWQ